MKKHHWILLGAIFALLILINFFIYYQYVYLVIKAQSETELEKTSIDQQTMEKVLSNLEARQDNLSRIQASQYANPFK